MGRGGQKDRLAKADATARIRGSTSQVGGGEDLFLDLSEQEDEQGLREAMRKCRSVHLRGHDPFDGEASSAWLRISKQFRKVNSPKFAPNTCGWHHAATGQASSEEDTFYEHLSHQDPSSYRRFQGGRDGRPNCGGPSEEDPLRVARGSRLWHRTRRTPSLSRSNRAPECRVRSGE